MGSPGAFIHSGTLGGKLSALVVAVSATACLSGDPARQRATQQGAALSQYLPARQAALGAVRMSCTFR